MPVKLTGWSLLLTKWYFFSSSHSLHTRQTGVLSVPYAVTSAAAETAALGLSLSCAFPSFPLPEDRFLSVVGNTALRPLPVPGMCVCMRVPTEPLSCVRLCDPMDCIACQAALSIGFSKQEYWSGLPLSSPRDLPKPGIEPTPYSTFEQIRRQRQLHSCIVW